MRIAINCRCFLKKQFTGVGRYAFNLVRCLSEIDQENEYFLYAPKDLFDFKRQFPKVGVRNFHVKGDLFRQGPDRILGAIDIYHAPCPEFVTVKEAKVIVSIHDLVYKAYPQGHNHATIDITDRQLQNIVECADKIICSSQSTLNDLQKYFEVDSRKLCVIYLGMNLDEFAPLRNDEHCKAKNTILKKGVEEPYLLFVGTIEPRKNLQNLLKAFAILKEKNRFKGKLVVIGMKGWNSDGLATMVEELGIKDRVIFPGFVTNEELRFFYTLSAALIMPSFYEGFGFPIVEAFNCGTPVVTSMTSSCGELAADCALTIDPHDVEGLAQSMERILYDDRLREHLKQKGFKRAQDFSYYHTARQTLQVYQEVYNKVLLTR